MPPLEPQLTVRAISPLVSGLRESGHDAAPILAAAGIDKATPEIGDDCAVLRHQLAGGAAVPRQTGEFLLTAWVRAGRVVTGVDWAPRAVHFAHPAPPDSSEHAQFFRTDLHFGMRANALVLSTRLLETPCARADPSLMAVLDRYAAERLERAPRTNSAADRVRSVLGDELRGGKPSAARLQPVSR